MSIITVILPREILEASAMASMRHGTGPTHRASNPGIPANKRGEGVAPGSALSHARPTIRPVAGR
jgi:hypothetical protein